MKSKQRFYFFEERKYAHNDTEYQKVFSIFFSNYFYLSRLLTKSEVLALHQQLLYTQFVQYTRCALQTMSKYS